MWGRSIQKGVERETQHNAQSNHVELYIEYKYISGLQESKPDNGPCNLISSDAVIADCIYPLRRGSVFWFTSVFQQPKKPLPSLSLLPSASSAALIARSLIGRR